MEELLKQIKVVAEAREHVTLARGLKDSAYQKWVEANQPLIDEESRAKFTCQEAESALRELTLKVFAKTGNKAPAPGVGIREVTKLDYDTKTAFEWAVEHTMALKLDTSAFEKIVKVSPPSFVTISLEPQATIATHLEVI